MNLIQLKTVQSGEDVLLLCQDHRGADIVLVKWIRPDLETELYVFFFRTHRAYKNYQHPSFHGRVTLRDPQSKDGDASLILKNITINDTGTYDCYVGLKGNSPQLINSFHLKVKDSDQQQITVKTGDDVTLQCLDHRGGDIEKLEWMKQDLKKNISIYKHEKMHKDEKQNPSFNNRVELRDPQMKDGDVSVILRNININDTGTYECYVRNSNTQPQPQLISNITMTVIDSGGDGGDKDRHVGLIVGLSVMCVLLLVVGVSFMIYRICKKHKMRKRRPPIHEAADRDLHVLNPEP
ncbi:myelin-oligodendrocyte glycoprotein-like [Channa argus]|uniref:myelin-oligodendrocyte glycoprotein-like n=1 Tax=Channa argus TaxID=215402 RepID=UPI00352062D2